MLRTNTVVGAVIAFACVCPTPAFAIAEEEPSPPPQKDAACAQKGGKTFSGRATWYGEELHGRKTASGIPFDMNKLTAAHPALPFGTKVLVKNEKTNRSCLVEINDRCPPRSNRVIDVSKEAARQLGILPGGHANVECVVIVSHGSLLQ